MQRNDNLNKIASAAVFVNITQIAMIAMLFVYLVFGMTSKGNIIETEKTVIFLCIILISVIINCYLTLKYINLIFYNNKYYRTLTETNNQLEKLNNTLRAQRHDFMNHLQVVYSLVELDDYSDARDYIEKVYSDIQKVNRALRTSVPAINALIQAKLISAEKSDIAVHINITTSLNKLIIPAWEFCRVIGNLIDNSIFALQSLDKGEHRELCIELFEDLKNYGFRIINNGPPVPIDMLDKIFESGFTTKKEKGEGMGLAITKEILMQYNGDVKVTSNEYSTEFTGWIPKSLEQIE